MRQCESDLADDFRLVALDLRGHGMSEAPLDAESYAGDAWALDVAAVLEGLSLERPILVGGSYGGYVICDYLRKFGESALAAMMVVPPQVRAALIGRELDFAPILEAIEVPVLVSHSRADEVVLPRMSEIILECRKTASASRFEGIGHAPFLEEAVRFNEELAAFARKAVVDARNRS